MTKKKNSRSATSHTRFVGVVTASILVIVMVIGLIGYAKLTTPAIPDYEGDGNGVTELVEIKPGSSVSALGPELVKRGIVESNAAFQQAAATNPKAATITPGFYKLQGRMSAASAVACLVDPAKKVQLLKVPNGATLEDVTVVGGDVRYGIYTKIAKLACPKKIGHQLCNCRAIG